MSRVYLYDHASRWREDRVEDDERDGAEAVTEPQGGIVTYNTLLGVSTIPLAVRNAAASLGAGRWAMLREVLLPGALPNIVTGIRTGLGFARRGLIAAGMIATNAGLGYMLFVARDFYRTSLESKKFGLAGTGRVIGYLSGFALGLLASVLLAFIVGGAEETGLVAAFFGPFIGIARAKWERPQGRPRRLQPSMHTRRKQQVGSSPGAIVGATDRASFFVSAPPGVAAAAPRPTPHRGSPPSSRAWLPIFT